MRIQLDFVENGVILTREVPQKGKNAPYKEILVFQDLTNVFDAISDYVAQSNEESA